MFSLILCFPPQLNCSGHQELLAAEWYPSPGVKLAEQIGSIYVWPRPGRKGRRRLSSGRRQQGESGESIASAGVVGVFLPIKFFFF